MGCSLASSLRLVRLSAIVLVFLNVVTCALAGVCTALARSLACPQHLWVSAILVCVLAGLRLGWTFGAASAQAAAAAVTISDARTGDLGASTSEDEGRQAPTKEERRNRYNRWLAWYRLGHIITLIQLAAVLFLTFSIAGAIYNRRLRSGGCGSSEAPPGGQPTGIRFLLLFTTVVAWVTTTLPCVVGLDVLAWRSMYEMEDNAWRTHYSHLFDQHIREVLCCLGRSRYWRPSVEDEVDTVSTLLGELLAYRAHGASHLDVLAGLALLRGQRPPHQDWRQCPHAPVELLQEAAALQPFAVAAYTGPLLDFGRNPCTWCCAWVYRQGMLMPWRRSRWPILQGDNIIRGHAAAFLRYVQLPPDCLLKGRVVQVRHWETVYFLAVVHHQRAVVVSVRGTQTPEDVITDALASEIELSNTDLGGLFSTLSSPSGQPCPRRHFAHQGVVIAARELAQQLDGMPISEDAGGDCPEEGGPGSSGLQSPSEDGAGGTGLLSQLLGPGGKCCGYSLRIVGHSLGGAIATVTGLRLRPRFPQLHVFAFNTLPALDEGTANACTQFVTSIVYNDDFASHLTVVSLLRLRSQALQATATQDRRGREHSRSLSPASSEQPLVATGADSRASTTRVSTTRSPARDGSRQSTTRETSAARDCSRPALAQESSRPSTPRNSSRVRGTSASPSKSTDQTPDEADERQREDIECGYSRPAAPALPSGEESEGEDTGWSRGSVVQRGRRKARQAMGIVCLCCHGVNCLCHMAMDKSDRTFRGRNRLRPTDPKRQIGVLGRARTGAREGADGAAAAGGGVTAGDGQVSSSAPWSVAGQAVNTGSGVRAQRSAAQAEGAVGARGDEPDREAAGRELQSEGAEAGLDKGSTNEGSGGGQGRGTNVVEGGEKGISTERGSGVGDGRASTPEGGSGEVDAGQSLTEVEANCGPARTLGERGGSVNAEEAGPFVEDVRTVERQECVKRQDGSRPVQRDHVVIEVAKAQERLRSGGGACLVSDQRPDELRLDSQSMTGNEPLLEGDATPGSPLRGSPTVVVDRRQSSSAGIAEVEESEDDGRRAGSRRGGDAPGELFVGGTVVHVLRVPDGARPGKLKNDAFLVDRTSLRDLPVSMSMFLDHLPWRLQDAICDVLAHAEVQERRFYEPPHVNIV